jgi:hypothetical protein
MPLDIEALLAEAELPETSVTLCLKGSLASRFEALDAQLSARPSTPGSLAGDVEAGQIAAELAAIRAEMLDHERVFLLRAMPALPFAAIRAAQPEKAGKSDTEFADAYHLWVCQVVAGTCYDPEMTVEQVDRLCAVLSDGQWRRLSNAAWSINHDDSTIPFSAAGYALTRTSAARSPQQETPASPEAGSLAGPSAPSPNTSTPTDS